MKPPRTSLDAPVICYGSFNITQYFPRSVLCMTLSFVIPAYNEERYLPGCLRAILRQTATLDIPVEIIVVNNASQDRTREVALSFPGVSVVDEPRKGLPFARQAGFLASTGHLIANVDADSLLPPGWIDATLHRFSADPDLAALSGPLVYHELNRSEDLMVRFFYAIAWLTYLVNRHVLRVGSMVQGGNFVVRRSALASIGGFDVDIPFYGEDTDIARRLNKVGNVQFIFSLKMPSSARRLRKEGIYRMAARYSANYLWTIFLKRPYTTEYIDIRECVEAHPAELSPSEAVVNPEFPSWTAQV